MALPPRPIAPPQALRSNPDTFSANAEASIGYQWTSLPAWIEDMGDFVVARANEANAAALTGDITPAPAFAGNALVLNQAGTALSYTDGLTGRNLIINGSGRINQRLYTSGTATTAANQFTLDRWFVITSGQSLTFTGNDSARVMTAPAGGVAQVIEGANIVGGTYVLNWTGTATATVGGTARTKGETFTLAANTNVTVRFTGGTFSDVQLERGSVVTPFEYRSIGQELALCQRYYLSFSAVSWRMAGTPAGGIGFWHYFPVYMRADPSVSLINVAFNVNSSGLTVENAKKDGFRSEWLSGSGASHSVVTFGYAADAELIT